ncbi:MAG TPA: tRNA guanosine(34) transglycosylase Tgt [Acidimicrobiia bacterium]|nr:tRNA guanosine(34) transglycosylase Tgt [Acidimicrobiia bacterium]
MTAVGWTPGPVDGPARTGTLWTPHGELETPAFMPVGTRAAVRALDVDDLKATGTEIVLANTYHLMLRPGAETVAEAGGLHGFWSWPGPILTDSGGFQIFSLQPRIDEEGATFRSVYDGGTVHLSPEEAVRRQELLGGDIAMVLDVCLALPAPREAVKAAMEMTWRWAERSRRAHQRPDQELFGIVQGGTDPELRAESAARTADLDFAGFGIGGLSVGETPAERKLALAAAFEHLPADRIRYVMGLGDPEGVMDAIELGADLFDCVWPTRLARHGRVFTEAGDFNLRRAQYINDLRPLEEGCSCHTCRSHHRAYLRHLLVNDELAAFRLLSLHNLTYTMRLLAGIREAIGAGKLADHLHDVREKRLRDRTG